MGELNKEEILESLGLSKNEAKVYLALLNIGQSQAGQIAIESKLHRTNVYDALDRLIKKGFASFISKGKTKFFEATDPRNLLGLLREKEEMFTRILPDLMLSKKLAKKISDVNIFEGMRVYKNMMEHFLELGEERVILGVPKDFPKRIGEGYLADYHKRRIRAKIPIRELLNEDEHTRFKYLNSLPLTEARYLPKWFHSPLAISICKDEVTITLTEKIPTIICIKNEKIANAYSGYFEMLWAIGEK